MLLTDGQDLPKHRQTLDDALTACEGKFVCDGRGAPMVDLVGRIEDFDAFVTEVARRSAVRLQNEVHRASARRPWQDYYSARAKAAVAALYREDFRAFGYAE